MSTICLRLSLFRVWKTITSSSRLRNSGRKYFSIGDLEPLLHLLVAGGVVAAAVEAEDVACTR